MTYLAEGGTIGSFTRSPVGQVHFGSGCIAEIGQVLARDGIRRAVVITGRSLAANPELMAALAKAMDGRCAGIFAETTPHVPRDVAIAAAGFIRSHQADAVISFGGSTQNDTAKAAVWAVAENLTSPEQFASYAIRFEYPSTRIVPAMRGSALPLYAVPTTLSAGEFTNIAGITDSSTGEKHLYQDGKLSARDVFLDPDLTLHTPDWLWLSSGVKAIDHCVEAWFSIRSQPLTDALAAEALGALFRFLPQTRREPSNLEARLQCQIAAWLSVFGLANVSLGLSHGLGHQLGGRCKVVHGYTSCVVLQHVVGFNRPAIAAREDDLCRRLQVSLGRPMAASTLQAELLRLVRDELGLPFRLRDLGVTHEDLPFVADAAMRDAIVATNPRPVKSAGEVLDLLKAAW